MRWPRSQKIVTFGCLSFSVAFVAVLVFRPLPLTWMQYFSNACQLTGSLFGAAGCFVYAKRRTQDTRLRRRAWLLIGLGCASWSIGQITWLYYECIRHVEVPAPGWPDVWFLSVYPALIAGIVMLFGSIPVVGRARLLLDSALVAGGAGSLSWYFLVEPLWQQSSVSLANKVLNASYPIADLGAMFCALALASASGGLSVQKAVPVVLAVGVAGVSLADTAYDYYSFASTYHTGMWVDAAWSFGWLLIGYAPLLQLWTGETAVPQSLSAVLPQRSLLRLTGPYLWVIGAFVVVAGHDYYQDEKIGSGTFGIGLALMVVVMARQVLTLVENQQFAKQIVSFNATLEKRVEERTRQMMALHDLTRAVNETLDAERVCAETLRHAGHALGADAVALWTLDADGGRRRAAQQGLDAHPAVLAAWDASPEGAHPAQKGGLQRVSAPLRWQQTTIGTISVGRWNAPFEESDAALLESLGLAAGAALENARRYQTAAHAADHDPVTGLLNHRVVHQRLAESLAQARADGNVLSVVLLDLDNFRLFNETYGHPVGDMALRQAASVLAEECAHGVVGRYGGDEFLLLLPGVAGTEARQFAQRLRERMQREGYQPPGDARTVPVTLCCGIVTFPDDCGSRHELLTLADAALAVGKRGDEGAAERSGRVRAHQTLRMDESFAVLDALITAVDNKDRYTRQHSEDVTDYALWIAEEMGLSEETMRIIRIGGLLHDVGKIGVPDEILRKPGRLTPEEYEVLKRHPHTGALLVAAIPGMEAIVDAVRAHHERWDGGGYPDALAGEKIPLIGRIMAVADAFSAIVTERPYRKGAEWNAALMEIKAHSGTQFDPVVAEAFLRIAARNAPPVPRTITQAA